MDVKEEGMSYGGVEGGHEVAMSAGKGEIRKRGCVLVQNE